MTLIIPKQKGNAKLTHELVRHYRQKFANGELTIRQIAQFMGMSYEPIRKMLNGDTWRDVADPKTAEQLDAEAAAATARMTEMIEKAGGMENLAKTAVEEMRKPISPSVQKAANFFLNREQDNDADLS